MATFMWSMTWNRLSGGLDKVNFHDQNRSSSQTLCKTTIYTFRLQHYLFPHQWKPFNNLSGVWDLMDGPIGAIAIARLIFADKRNLFVKWIWNEMNMKTDYKTNVIGIKGEQKAFQEQNFNFAPNIVITIRVQILCKNYFLEELRKWLQQWDMSKSKLCEHWRLKRQFGCSSS